MLKSKFIYFTNDSLDRHNIFVTLVDPSQICYNLLKTFIHVVSCLLEQTSSSQFMYPLYILIYRTLLLPGKKHKKIKVVINYYNNVITAITTANLDYDHMKCCSINLEKRMAFFSIHLKLEIAIIMVL